MSSLAPYLNSSNIQKTTTICLRIVYEEVHAELLTVAKIRGNISCSSPLHEHAKLTTYPILCGVIEAIWSCRIKYLAHFYVHRKKNQVHTKNISNLVNYQIQITLLGLLVIHMVHIKFSEPKIWLRCLHPNNVIGQQKNKWLSTLANVATSYYWKW